jgi:antirestriction protein ArdC
MNATLTGASCLFCVYNPKERRFKMKTTAARPAVNVYEMVNQRIMELLEQGTIPWRKPWNVETGQPKNLISKRHYHGVNAFLLACSPYGSPYWLTYKQAVEKGGHVKKGEKSSLVVFWKWIDRKGAVDSEDVDACDAGTGKIPLLRYYNVFNLDQTEGIDVPTTIETKNIFTPIEKAEQIVSGMPLKPEILHGGSKAAYSPSFDRIKMPQKQTFNTPEEYYCTLFHELSHSTGSEKRLARKSLMEVTGFGSHEYSKEEMVAEMSSAFLCAFAGIEQKTLENSASYIASWLKVLANDKKMLVMAAAQGQKAADYILNRKEDQIELDEAA